MHTDTQKPFDISETIHNIPDDTLIDKNIPEDTKKPKKRPWFRYGCGGLIIIMLGCIGTFAFFAQQTSQATPHAENALTFFFQHMESQEFEDAHQLFSQRGKQIVTLETLVEFGSDANTILFSGFEDIDIQSLQIRRQFNTYELAPKGTIANVRAISKYSGDIQGKVTAILEKEGDAWYLHTINITVPTSKQE